MFETEPVLWFQSFASDWLTAVMTTVSWAGYTRTYLALSLLIMFGWSFRAGFFLLQLVLWNGVLTDALKNAFELPRPAEIDSAVQLLGQDSVNDAPFQSADGDHFFDLPEPEAIWHYRLTAAASYGLPSGHVSMATAFWTGLATLVRSRLLTGVAVAIVVLMAISRMYLGRHFLADVLGGTITGLLIVVVIQRLLPRVSGTRGAARAAGKQPRESLSRFLLLTALLGLPILIWLPASELDSVGRLMGANLAFALLATFGGSVLQEEARHRVVSASLALLLFIVCAEYIERLDVVRHAWGSFLNGFLPIFVAIMVTALVGSVGERARAHTMSC